MSDSKTNLNYEVAEDDEDNWAAAPQKKKKNRNRRPPPHHDDVKKPQKDDDTFPSFLDSIPSYIHPPPPPFLPPSLATLRIANTDNDEAEAGDVLGSVEEVASTDDPIMILLVGFPGK
jgi:hypothetical protein